jgi:hypothetical protein
MRQLKYGVEGKAENLHAFAVDEPGHGGACHEYLITDPSDKIELGHIKFQNGPINADGNGINGLQIEDLLAICIDRLDAFESGDYSCFENGAALNHCQSALRMLQQRTLDRIRRKVEGTHTV